MKLNQWLGLLILVILVVLTYVLYEGLVVTPEKIKNQQEAIRVNNIQLLQICLSSAEKSFIEVTKLPGANETQTYQMLVKQNQETKDNCYKQYPQN